MYPNIFSINVHSLETLSTHDISHSKSSCYNTKYYVLKWFFFPPSVYRKLHDFDSSSDHQDSQEHVQTGAQGHSAIAVFSVTVSTVRSITLISKAALQLHSSITHVGFITEWLKGAGLHYRFYRGKTHTDTVWFVFK